MITYDDFTRVDMRVGKVQTAELLQGARKPAYKMTIDFGPLGTRTSSAQVTHHYTPEDLVGRLVIAVVNFPPRRVAGFKSEVLVLGVDAGGGVTLLAPDRPAPPGTRVY